MAATIAWTEHSDIVRKKRRQSLRVLSLLLLLSGVPLLVLLGMSFKGYRLVWGLPGLIITVALNMAMMSLIVSRMRLWMATGLNWQIGNLELTLDSRRQYTLDELGGFAEAQYDGQHAIRFFPKLRLAWIESVYWACIGGAGANLMLISLFVLASPRTGIPFFLAALFFGCGEPTLFLLALRRYSDPIYFPITVPPEVNFHEVLDALRLRLTRRAPRGDAIFAKL